MPDEIQREILPRLTGEFVYHRRIYTNLTLSDQLTIGCDRFGGATDCCIRTRDPASSMRSIALSGRKRSGT